jgi:hypothetical protein
MLPISTNDVAARNYTRFGHVFSCFICDMEHARQSSDRFARLFDGKVSTSLPSWTLIPLALVSALLLCQLGAHLFSTPKPLNDVAGALAAAAVFFAVAAGRKPATAPEKTAPAACALPESWEETKDLLAAFYGQHGYAVEEVGHSGPYRGFDLALWKNGKKTLCQCRHWQVARVDELTVHQLHKVQTTERAHRSIMLTHGKFTAGARSFAAENGMELIDGARCAEMLRHLQDAPMTAPAMLSAPANLFMLQQS